MAASAATDRTGLQWRAVRRGDLEGGWPLRGEFRFRAPFYRAWRAAGHPADCAAAGKSGRGAVSGVPGEPSDSTDVPGEEAGQHQEPVRGGAQDGSLAAGSQAEAVERV